MAFRETYYNEKRRKDARITLWYYRLDAMKMSPLHLMAQIKTSLVTVADPTSSKSRGRGPYLRARRTLTPLHKDILFLFNHCLDCADQGEEWQRNGVDRAGLTASED